MADDKSTSNNQVNDVELDLDELTAAGKKIKFGGQIITVQQPDTEQLFQLIRLGQKMSSKDSKDVDVDELESLIAEVNKLCGSLAPELKDAKLNLAQALVLIQFVTGMTQTQQMKELKDRGITPAESPKDAASSEAK